jgi:two-component system, OmpR family, phosphate regulon response regulator OmpR
MYPEGKQILVIDDDARRRQLIERILTEEGFAVTAVAQGFSAIRAAAGGPFALAITAVNLPGTLDGANTMRQLRARQPSLKALFTGDVAQSPRRPDRSCDDFIPSPFHRRDLLGCVFELLQREIGHGQIACRHHSRAG